MLKLDSPGSAGANDLSSLSSDSSGDSIEIGCNWVATGDVGHPDDVSADAVQHQTRAGCSQTADQLAQFLSVAVAGEHTKTAELPTVPAEQYTLAADDGDTLVCNLFWDQSSQAIGDAGGATAVPGVEQQGPQNVHSLEGISGINPPPVAHERLRFTGAGTDIPLAIATDRAMHNPTHRLAAPRVHASFVDFLRARMVEVAPSIPEGQWPRAKTAGIILQRIQIQEKVLAHFTPWSKPSGGYIVPAGSGEYSGVIFTKPEILEALRLKGSNSTSDLKIFTPDALLRNPQAKLWYESGGKTNDDYFGNMKLSNFKAYLEGDHRKERRKERSRDRRRRSSSVEEGPSRKHRKTHVSSGTEDESEDEQHLAKKSKSAGKRKATADSEDLDK
ncbi:hypothetical protein B0H10DRAFT_2236558 [Mycena sp. CBHHK59/15]|nr:hypothetical protein B0H10DRAFT_2236558 [Mycena sp. CBHHK59/15]